MRECERAQKSKSGIKAECYTCKATLWLFPYKAKRERNFCSTKCRRAYVTPLMIAAAHKSAKGKKYDEKRLSILKDSLPRGANHHGWKGPKVQYRALHEWVEGQLGKPYSCDLCGKDNLRHRQYHWANLSGLYMRDLNDWSRMCAKCHKQYDKIDRDFKKLSAITEMAY